MAEAWRRTLSFLHALLVKWQQDEATRLAGALAFFTALSLAPLLVLATVIGGSLLQRDTVQQEVVSRAREIAGPAAAEVVTTVLENASLGGAGIVATVLAVLGLAFAASNVFVQLQHALNEVWDIAARPGRGLRGILIDRIEAFLVVLLVGGLLVASPVLRLLLGRAQDLVAGALPGLPWLWPLLNELVNLTLFTLLFAVIFKMVPSARITWRPVLLGAAFTGLLFWAGTALLTRYLSGSATTSLYGAAGSLMALLLWIYFSAQILFVGAEATQLWARVRGEPIEPYDYAVRAYQERARKRHQVERLLRRARGMPAEEGAEAAASAAPPADSATAPDPAALGSQAARDPEEQA